MGRSTQFAAPARASAALAALIRGGMGPGGPRVHVARLRPLPCQAMWLVTGGAGYIGAHITHAMRDAGQPVMVLDDVSTGDAARLPDVPFVRGSVLDGDLLARTLREHGVSGVVHVAAKKQVEESVRRPLFYYEQNVEGLRTLLEAATDAGVGSFLFSSSAAVYGSPDVDLVVETTPCRPANPYGTTKLVGERMVQEVAAATGLRYANLRYFNVAGCAAPELADRGVSNLVPMVLQRLTRHEPPLIFGDDYPTPDGTCIRDFIHVADVAGAHVAAARALADGSITELTANIGRGEGISVRAMIELLREATQTADEPWSQPRVEARRPGDPARVVASADTIRKTLGWEARYGVPEMVASAWAGWQRD
jgi:UDP-glucose 4-epimerase